MADLQNDKNSGGPTKPFMTAGPTLHYSHGNVTTFWFMALLVYILACLMWSKVLAGSFASFSIESIFDPMQWRLEKYVLSPLSIFEYPWHIVVLGLLMGMLAVMPPLISQLLSFAYGMPFLLSLAFVANLPTFALFVLISCVASSCRPLRFRSRFIAIALCMTPQLFYWAYFGGVRNIEPVKWGFSFAPWICAWITTLIFAGMVLLIGHFNRYRPGLNWFFGVITLVSAILIFHNKIGFDELAFQQHVAKNNPEEMVQFQNRSFKVALDKTLENPVAQKYFVSLFYPSDKNMLRQTLREEIQAQLAHDRWPSWFSVPANLNFPAKRQLLINQYDQFISGNRPWWLPEVIAKKFERRRLRSKRMPIALYYKAMLCELSPCPVDVINNETLNFYNEYPHRLYLPIWYQIYEQYPQSFESIEARRRVAIHLAGQGKFDSADALLNEALDLIKSKPTEKEQAFSSSTGLFIAFSVPQDSGISKFKLVDLQRRIDDLHNLICKSNLPNDQASRQRIAKFILLDPHSLDYAQQLNELLTETLEKDALRDNLLLAKVMLINDWHKRSEELAALHEKFKGTDGGICALYELGILKVRLWQELPQANIDGKKHSLASAKAVLTSFMSLYPKSFFASLAKNVLQGLP